MHAENIKAMKHEVLRLLDYTVDVLKAITDTPGLLRESDPEQRRLLDTKKAAKCQGILKDEIKKVKNLEAVFAVVGTVKAGKSTAINAIVGAEILPNRPEPMTTYPTLVRHKPGQAEPVLDFPAARSFNSLARKAQKKLRQQTSKTPLDKLYPDPHERAIAEKILEGQFKIATRSEGKAKIFDLLKTVNDLYRLCGLLGLELPTTADRLPALEIDMHHIGTGDTGVGQFTILDLPGPNEFGQSGRLREIVQKQLDRASAVVLVSDFTQRKTEADNEIQELVNNELAHLTDRIFIFVNKFDQRRAGDWNEEETRRYLANTLLNGAVASERIYPVSALQAFLANWAQRQLKESGRLPAPEKSSFTQDFGRDAFGTRWERSIDKYDEVKSRADELWKESSFADPLENVIRVATRNASLVCLKAATGKLLDYSRTLDSFLKSHNGAMTKDVKELQKAIGDLQGDIEKINKKKETAEGIIKARLDDFPKIIRVGCEDWSGQLRQVIEQYFKTGKVSPPPQGGLKENFRKFLDHIGKWIPERFKKPLDIPAQQAGPDFSPQPVHEFRDSGHKDKAQKLIESIRKRIQPVYHEAASQIEQRLNEISEELSNQITTDVEKELRDILEKAKERLQRDFQITLDFPKLELNIDTVGLEEIDPALAKQRSESYTIRKEKTHIFAPVTRFFGSIFEEDWGYDVVHKQRQISTIDMATLQRAAMKGLGRFSSEMHDGAKALAQAQEKALDSHFDNLKKYLEAHYHNLLDAREYKRREADSLGESHSRIQKFLSEVEDVLHDTKKFNESLEASDGAERPSR